MKNPWVKFFVGVAVTIAGIAVLDALGIGGTIRNGIQNVLGGFRKPAN